MINLKKLITEKKVPTYYTTYSGAVQSAIQDAESRGYEVDMDDVWNKISTGPKKPSVGKTNSAVIGLIKNGKPQRKSLSISVYGMKNGYELTHYIA